MENMENPGAPAVRQRYDRNQARQHEARTGSFENVSRQHALDFVNVEFLVELLLYRLRCTGHPYLQFGIEIEMSGSLDAEVGNGAIRQRMVLDLGSGDALL